MPETRPRGRWGRGGHRKQGAAAPEVVAEPEAVGVEAAAPAAAAAQAAAAAPAEALAGADALAGLASVAGAEVALIKEGRFSEQPPRGAGVIAVARAEGEPLVLLVRNRSGKVSFPKGGREPGESVLGAALREWREETGLATALTFGGWLDDAPIGSRYLLALFRGPVDEPWAPPAEDPHDTDPVVCAQWVLASASSLRQAGLSAHRAALVRTALARLRQLAGRSQSLASGKEATCE